jgi:hypothetical protein
MIFLPALMLRRKTIRYSTVMVRAVPAIRKPWRMPCRLPWLPGTKSGMTAGQHRTLE